MNWISTQFARHWRNIQYSAVVALSAILIIWPVGVDQVVRPIVLNGFYYPFFKLRNGIELLSSQSKANDELREALTASSLELAASREAVRENERLRQLLGFEPPSGYRLMPAEVVSVSGGELPVSAVINRGGGEEVYLNQPVINQQGLIGRVSSLTDGFATVQLLTDPANRVASRVDRSREMGIVRYVPGRGMVLDNFPIFGDIAVGDTVLSSGLGGVYPPGLIVGIVTDVHRTEHAAFAEVAVDPAANFHSIEELFLLRWDDVR